MEFCLLADSFVGSTLVLLWTIFKVAAGLGFVIFVHELGHFLVAKACGVKCEKFYVGFDVPIWKLPRTLFKFQRGETEYGIGIIPLGGYVKMLGQDDNPANYQKEAERIRVAKMKTAEQEAAESATAGHEAEEAEGTVPAPADTTEAAMEPVAVELDPRSFPAKRVWQRMAIISAGVIMNLIFAVVFAAIAYRIGVSYTPCVVGGISMGSPAWKQGWEQGDQIIGIGNQAHNEHLRFTWDLAQSVYASGGGRTVKPLKLTLRTRDGEQRTDEVKASTELKELFGYVSIGVRPVATTVLSGEMPVWKHRVAGQTSIPFQSADRIVAIDGRSLARDPQTRKYWAHDLTTELVAKVDQTVVLTVERQAKNATDKEERIDISVPPAPMVRLGLVMEMGSITAIQRGSLAEKWEIQPGDFLHKVNGVEVDDPLTLPQQFTALAGQAVQLEFKRKGWWIPIHPEPLQVAVDALPRESYLPFLGLGAKIGLESIGICYAVRPVVRRVLPSSPAATAGMQAGDELTSVEFNHQPTNADDRRVYEKYFKEEFGYAVPIDLKTTPITWVDVHHSLQTALPETKVKVKYLRGTEEKKATLVGEPSKDSFFPIRGFNFGGLERTCRTDSWGAAAALGFRETKEKLGEVGRVLSMLFRREISVKNLGGPVLIAKIAGVEAAQGVPRLLIFLTFLSANLAVLNFLPIPALDGGHMVFLIVEGVSGRPVNERVQGMLTLVGVACLLALMVFVLYNDIARLFL